jgi:hypothetical protein
MMPSKPLYHGMGTCDPRCLVSQGVERDQLLKRIEEMTTRFDEALMKLRREKIDLEMNLKAAEVQLLVLVQEHGLLVEFSARDDALAGKLAEKQGEQRVRQYTEH